MPRSRSFWFQSSGPSAPRGHRAYAVGDVHGRLDLLQSLLSKIEADNSGRRRAKTTIVFLGDLIDRGPDSAGVVELLRSYRPAFARTAFLMGNHEEVMLRVLDGDADLLGQWLSFGGAECVRSYGIDPRTLKRMPADDAVALLRNKVPKGHVEFLRTFGDSISFGSYVFVHAGIRPGVPLSEQEQHDLRWIREPFLADERDHGFIVVHGHTMRQEVDICSNRIGVDTGAYRTGKLTAIGIETGERWFVQSVETEAKVVTVEPAAAV